MSYLKKLNVRLVVLLLGVSLVSAGCGGTAKPKAKTFTLTVWGTFETTANMAPLLTAYQKVNPNATIIYKVKNYDTYEQDLIQAFASGTAPDVFEIHNDWLPKYQQYMSPAPATVINAKQLSENFVDVVSKDFTGSDSKIYGLPISIDTLALYYNKSILGSVGIATPPQTWDQLRADSKLIAKQDSTGYFTRSGVGMGTTSNIERPEDILYLLMLQNGAVPYLSDHSSTTLDKSIQDSTGNQVYPATGAIHFYTDFSNSASPYYTWNGRSNYVSDAFANGQLGFMYGYEYERDIIASKAPNLNYGIAQVPQPNLSQNPVDFASYWGFGVSKQSKDTADSWSFINAITQKTTLEAYYAGNPLPSPRRDIIQEQENDPNIGVFAYEALNAKSLWKKDTQKTDKIFTNLIDNVSIHGMTIQDALSNTVQQLNSMLNS